MHERNYWAHVQIHAISFNNFVRWSQLKYHNMNVSRQKNACSPHTFRRNLHSLLRDEAASFPAHFFMGLETTTGQISISLLLWLSTIAAIQVLGIEMLSRTSAARLRVVLSSISENHCSSGHGWHRTWQWQWKRPQFRQRLDAWLTEQATAASSRN